MNKSLTRRIIAIMVATCYLGVMTYLSLLGVSEALIALIATGSIVTGFYFGTKASQT